MHEYLEDDIPMKLKNPHDPNAPKNKWHLKFAWEPVRLTHDSAGRKLPPHGAGAVTIWWERYWRKSMDQDSERPWLRREYDPALKALGLVDVQVQEAKDEAPTTPDSSSLRLDLFRRMIAEIEGRR